MPNDNIRLELSDYTTRLTSAKVKLTAYQTAQDDGLNQYTQHSLTLIVAIDGLLAKLAQTDPDTINLTTINTIADEATNVLSSTHLFFGRRSVIAR